MRMRTRMIIETSGRTTLSRVNAFERYGGDSFRSLIREHPQFLGKEIFHIGGNYSLQKCGHVCCFEGHYVNYRCCSCALETVASGQCVFLMCGICALREINEEKKQDNREKDGGGEQ